MAKSILRDTVVIEAKSENGEAVERHRIGYSDYYSSDHPVIDSSKYRADRGVRSVEGAIYNSTGVLEQHFINRYDMHGEYIGGRAVFSDGTVQED